MAAFDAIKLLFLADTQTQTQQSWTCCWWQQSSCSGHLQQARTCRRWRSSSALYKYFANKNTHVICACTYPTTKHMVLNEIHFILRKNQKVAEQRLYTNCLWWCQRSTGHFWRKDVAWFPPRRFCLIAPPSKQKQTMSWLNWTFVLS